MNATPTTESDRDVVDILTADHHEVLELIGTIADLPVEQRRDIADTVISELVRHSVAEEMFVYPAIREQLPDGEQTVQHDIEEHKELERTMKSLERADVEDPQFLALVDELTEQLRHHAQDEEDEQFPRLREHLSPADLLELGDKVQTAKLIAPTRPHPLSPNSEVFHKLVGPGVGLVDRLRDKLTGRQA